MSRREGGNFRLASNAEDLAIVMGCLDGGSWVHTAQNKEWGQKVIRWEGGL